MTEFKIGDVVRMDSGLEVEIHATDPVRANVFTVVLNGVNAKTLTLVRPRLKIGDRVSIDRRTLGGLGVPIGTILKYDPDLRAYQVDCGDAIEMLRESLLFRLD